MIRRIGWLVLVVVAALVVFAGGGLVWAHIGIRSIAPPLPNPAEVQRYDERADLPVRLRWVATARQRMQRAGVLEPALDPEPSRPYAMVFPAFVLEWADGRIFLVDAGMDREAAREFGAPAEWLAGAEPIEPLVSVAEALGPAVDRVGAIAFTHLHSDHTNGLLALCERRTSRLRVVRTPLQAEGGNYTTSPGRRHLAEARCADLETLGGGALQPVPGFPGVALVEAGGHTPCTQIAIAHLRTESGVRTIAFAGDIANHIEGIRRNIPKPRLYSLLFVPEAPERLQALRGYLHDLEQRNGVTVLVSHDLLALEQSGFAQWGGAADAAPGGPS